MARQASLLVADEIFFNLQGKAILHGIYTGDLVIATVPAALAQLIFFFNAETDLSTPFKSLAVQVTLPESQTVTHVIPIEPHASQLLTERTTLFIRYPMFLPNPILRPGRIVAKLVHDRGEISVSAPWIVEAAKPAGLTKSN
jgi:hypothetical protein